MQESDLVREDPNLEGPWQEMEISAGAVVFIPGGPPQILTLRRKDGLLTLPKGHVEKNESNRDAVLRELFEETHISQSKVELLRFLGFFSNPVILSGGERVFKIVAYYLFRANPSVKSDIITDTEHVGYHWLGLNEVKEEWFAWSHIPLALRTALQFIDAEPSNPPPSRGAI
jgi:DNA polymerase